MRSFWPTRIVDAVEIDDAGFDKPTQFEQVMPIATVSRAWKVGGDPARIDADLQAAIKKYDAGL